MKEKENENMKKKVLNLGSWTFLSLVSNVILNIPIYGLIRGCSMWAFKVLILVLEVDNTQKELSRVAAYNFSSPT